MQTHLTCRRTAIAASALALAFAVSFSPAARADTVDGVDSGGIQLTSLTANPDGTLTYAGTYMCAQDAGYTDMDIGAMQDQGSDQMRIDGYGTLGSAPSCDGSATPFSITLQPDDPNDAFAAQSTGTDAQFVNADGSTDTTDDAGRVAFDDAAEAAASAPTSQHQHTLSLAGSRGLTVPTDVPTGANWVKQTGAQFDPNIKAFSIYGKYQCTGKYNVVIGEGTQDYNGTRTRIEGKDTGKICDGKVRDFTMTADGGGDTGLRNDKFTLALTLEYQDNRNVWLPIGSPGVSFEITEIGRG